MSEGAGFVDESPSLMRPTTVLGPLSRRADWWPLTARQSLIWADGQLLEVNRYHHWVLWIRFDGAIDVERFQNVWNETVRAHDALSLIVDTRTPRQRFAVGLPTLRLVDLSEDVPVEHWIAEQATKEYAPARQLWEAALVQGANGEFCFMFRAHYQICDERSFYIIATELNARYDGRSVEPAGKFRDSLFCATAKLETHETSARRDAWKQLMADSPPVAVPLGLVRTDDKPGVVRISRWMGSELQYALERQILGDLFRSTATDSPYTLLVLTVTFAWLHLLSGQADLVVSTSLDQRHGPEDRTVGLLSDLYLLRIKIEDHETFLSLSNKVRSALKFAQDNSDVSLGDPGCVSAFVGSQPSWPTTFCGSPACYQIGSALVYATVGLGRGDSRGVAAIRHITEDLGLGMQFDFERSIFPSDVRCRLVDYYCNLLKALSDDPNQRLDVVDWIPPNEIAWLKACGQGRQPDSAPDVVERFSYCVQRNPNHIALEFLEKQLSYAQLDRLTNRLARRLQSLGVRQESRVAVALPRGLGETVALLATLKAQGAYVPIDPSHPVDRVRVILEDAAPEVLIAPSNSLLLSAVPKTTAFCKLDDLDCDNEQFSDAALDSGATAEGQLAYILFTSGSTGRPKGVEITRGAFANFLQSMALEPGLTSTDRVVAITTTTFDIAGLEIFLPLYVGATIVMADKDTATDPLQLRALLEHRSISLMQATPATWRLLLDTGWQGDAQLRMLCGGEAMSAALAQRLLRCGAELWNVYGPTETTVWSTIERIQPEAKHITIGHPIDHTVVELRDNRGRLVAPGAIGEICIAGRGLARGYRGRPDLTAERFCYEPMTGQRYYRTGDLGRWLPDGKLTCLGRIDHQVKIRGFRIELPDIETQLRSVPGVKEVLVVVLGSGEEDPQLVAYWVGEASRDALHDVARAKLPNYMVPSAFVHLAAFPMTTSGKIDRKQLPRPEQTPRQDIESHAVAPRNDRESVVASIFREILGLAFVPVNQDFFALGGTSVRAVRLRAKIADALGINLPLRVLFDKPTVEGIVAQLDQSPNPDDPVVSWFRKSSLRVPWIGIMGIHLFEDLARALPDEQPFLAIHIPARYIPRVDPFPSVVELARKYVEVIRKEHPRGPYFLLGLCHGGVVAFEVAVQLEQLGERVGIVGLLDAELPRARGINRGAKLRSFVKKLLVEPREMGRKSVDAIGREIFGSPNFPSSGAREDSFGEAIDMPFDGPEIERELLDYESLRHYTSAQVLAFRATRNDLPPWIVIEPALGWKGRSASLTCHDIPSSHIGIVREPASTQVARYLDESKRAAGA